MGIVTTLFSRQKSCSLVCRRLLVMFGGFGSSRRTEAACAGSPMVATDKSDYGPTETVVISGTGFGSVLCRRRSG